MAIGFSGQITASASPYSADSYLIEHSNVPFGAVVVSDKMGFCRLPDPTDVFKKGASTGVAVGVTILEKVARICPLSPLVLPMGNGETEYKQEKTAISVMRTGNIFVKTLTEVKANGKVYFIVKGEDKALGSIVGDNANAIELKGARFVNSANAGDIVEIELSLNGQIQEEVI
jgi:hypothetical protein